MIQVKVKVYVHRVKQLHANRDTPLGNSCELNR